MRCKKLLPWGGESSSFISSMRAQTKFMKSVIKVEWFSKMALVWILLFSDFVLLFPLFALLKKGKYLTALSHFPTSIPLLPHFPLASPSPLIFFFWGSAFTPFFRFNGIVILLRIYIQQNCDFVMYTFFVFNYLITI